MAYNRVFNPNSGKNEIFRALVLPFGAVRSVHSFLRLARSIWWLGAKCCDIVWTSFYDDYIVFNNRALVKSTELAAGGLFKLLGWLYAEEGKKCVPFGTSCEGLGVIFDVSGSPHAVCIVANTELRVIEIVEEIERLICKGYISQSEAQRLRGRMQFAEAQIFGRAAKRCMATLKIASVSKSYKLKDCDVSFLKSFAKVLQTNEPRKIRVISEKPCMILTDECYEVTPLTGSADWEAYALMKVQTLRNTSHFA